MLPPPLAPPAADEPEAAVPAPDLMQVYLRVRPFTPAELSSREDQDVSDAYPPPRLPGPRHYSYAANTQTPTHTYICTHICTNTLIYAHTRPTTR